MIYFVLTVVALAAVALIYALVVRPWLKTQSWSQGFFNLVEPIELAFFKKSETILVGRLLWVSGLVVTFYDFLAVFVQGLDLTPVTTRVFDFLHIAPDLRSVATSAFLTGIGLMINWLRKRTTKPVELVAVPEQTDRTVQTALERADIAKEQAVAAVKAA